MITNLIATYACRRRTAEAIFLRHPKGAVCSISLVCVATFFPTPAYTGDSESDTSRSRTGFLHCEQTNSDTKRLECYDQLMHQADADFREALGPAAADLTQCANLVQDSVRAACFDAAASVVGESLASESNRPVRSEPTIAETKIGQEQLQTVAQKKGKTKAMRINATVVEIHRNAFGMHSFHLDNGQIWQQTESERFVPPESDFEVEIKRGAISGYRLHLENQNKILRVKRIQ